MRHILIKTNFRLFQIPLVFIITRTNVEYVNPKKRKTKWNPSKMFFTHQIPGSNERFIISLFESNRWPVRTKWEQTNEEMRIELYDVPQNVQSIKMTNVLIL